MNRRDVEKPGISHGGIYRWDAASGTILVRMLSTSTVRDVVSALVDLAHALDGQKSVLATGLGVCAIVNGRLSTSRLASELARMQALLRPELSARLHIVKLTSNAAGGAKRITGSLTGTPSEFTDWLWQLAGGEAANAAAPLAMSPRHAVIARLANDILAPSRPATIAAAKPVTATKLARDCDTSLATVSHALAWLRERGWLPNAATRDEGIRMRPLATPEWLALAREHAYHRRKFLFYDPAGLTRVGDLMERLQVVQEKGALPGVAYLAGVAGAQEHFPRLDLTGAARLDLSITASPQEVARVLDAGLAPASSQAQRAILALHPTVPAVQPRQGQTRAGLARWLQPSTVSAVDYKQVLANRDAQLQPQGLASALDCLSDLLELGYVREATEFAEHLEALARQSARAKDSDLPHASGILPWAPIVMPSQLQ